MSTALIIMGASFGVLVLVAIEAYRCGESDGRAKLMDDIGHGSLAERNPDRPHARVGRPEPSAVYREWWKTTEQLAANLTAVGEILREQERAK